jgi:hypothetical protein
MCWKAAWFWYWGGSICCSTGAPPCWDIPEPSSSSSSSSSLPLPLKSAGPLCSLAPPYCRRSARCLEPRVAARETYELVSGQNFSNIATRILVQLFVVAKDDHGNVDRAQNRQLMRLLEQASFALEKGSTQTRQRLLWGPARGMGRTKTYTERFRSSLMALISIFLRPIAATRRCCGRRRAGSSNRSTVTTQRTQDGGRYSTLNQSARKGPSPHLSGVGYRERGVSAHDDDTAT